MLVGRLARGRLKSSAEMEPAQASDSGEARQCEVRIEVFLYEIIDKSQGRQADWEWVCHCRDRRPVDREDSDEP